MLDELSKIRIHTTSAIEKKIIAKFFLKKGAKDDNAIYPTEKDYEDGYHYVGIKQNHIGDYNLTAGRMPVVTPISFNEFKKRYFKRKIG